MDFSIVSPTHFILHHIIKKFNVKMLINECIVILGNIIGTLPIALLVNKIRNDVQQNSSSDSL